MSWLKAENDTLLKWVPIVVGRAEAGSVMVVFGANEDGRADVNWNTVFEKPSAVIGTEIGDLLEKVAVQEDGVPKVEGAQEAAISRAGGRTVMEAVWVFCTKFAVWGVYTTLATDRDRGVVPMVVSVATEKDSWQDCCSVRVDVGEPLSEQVGCLMTVKSEGTDTVKLRGVAELTPEYWPGRETSAVQVASWVMRAVVHARFLRERVGVSQGLRVVEAEVDTLPRSVKLKAKGVV